MPVDEVEAAALAGHLGEIVGAAHGAPVLVLSGPAPADMGTLTSALSLLPCVVVAGPGDTSLRPFVDVVPGDHERGAVVDAALRHPLAATSLVLLLRGGERRTVEEGLVAESTTYSMLQASPEFARWRRSHPVRHRRRSGSPLRVERDGDDLVITLQRQEVHNAYDMAMRDALVDALRLVAVDPAVRVVLRADGPSFCSGGDLDEFGLRPDPATAHTVRLARSAAYLLSRVASRVSVEVHGACRRLRRRAGRVRRSRRGPPRHSVRPARDRSRPHPRRRRDGQPAPPDRPPPHRPPRAHRHRDRRPDGARLGARGCPERAMTADPDPVVRIVAGLVDGHRLDVRCAGGVITHVDREVPPGGHAVQADGGEVIPALHDHHIHLLALAAAASSVDVSPATVRDGGGMARALRDAPGDGWLRAVGYHESVAGDLDRHGLDAFIADRPLRVQHRSGRRWILNSLACRLTQISTAAPTGSVERGADGEITGRVTGDDQLLRDRIPPLPLDLHAVGLRLAGYGVAAVTDLTPTTDPAELKLLTRHCLHPRSPWTSRSPVHPNWPRTRAGSRSDPRRSSSATTTSPTSRRSSPPSGPPDVLAGQWPCTRSLPSAPPSPSRLGVRRG